MALEQVTAGVDMLKGDFVYDALLVRKIIRIMDSVHNQSTLNLECSQG